jgi:hypothetical protein
VETEIISLSLSFCLGSSTTAFNKSRPKKQDITSTMAIVTKSQMTFFDPLTLWQSLCWRNPRSYANSHKLLALPKIYMVLYITVEQVVAVLPMRVSLGLYVQQSEHVLLISLISIDVI